MGNLYIQFNKTIIKQLKALNIPVDQIGSTLLILFGLYEDNIELLDEFDDRNSQRRAILLYKELEINGYLREGDIDNEEPLYVLTKEGIELVEFIKTEFSKNESELTGNDIAEAGEKGVEQAIASGEVESWIDEWVDLFPRGVKSGGKLVRSDKQSCLRKMKVFLREYDYDKNTIIGATRNYVNSKKDEGYNFMRCAVYFIYRIDSSKSDKTSDLAAWCEQYNHDEQEGKNHSQNNIEFMV